MTQVIRTRAELRAALAASPRPIGLVPTMGWLHEGHRSLMRRARIADATTVVTIFVNPRQFGVASDFTRYPRDEARDVEIFGLGVGLDLSPYDGRSHALDLSALPSNGAFREIVAMLGGHARR